MPDNIKLKQFNLKFFLYHFFIIWNLLIIILLVLLTFYLDNKKVIKPEKIKKDIQVSGQFKLFWQSKKEFQNIDPDIYYIDIIKSNNDDLYDFITLSKKGHITVFDGENGHILFNKKTGDSESRFSVPGPHIIIGNTDGKIHSLSKSGKQLWTIQLDKALKLKTILSLSNIITKKSNTSAKSNISTEKSNIKTYNLTNMIKAWKKPGKNRIAGKIQDIFRNIIQTVQGVYSVNPSSGKINNSFKHFNTRLSGQISYGKFNDDDIDDYLVCGTNSIHCLDGGTLKQLWQRKIPYVFSGNKSIIFNKKKDMFVLIPLFNGEIKILNKHGTDVSEIKINENLVDPPLVIKNKYFIFIQLTLENNLYAFDFERRKNIWSISMSEKIIDLRNADIDYDNIDELFILLETGKIYIINSESGKALDFSSCLENTAAEKVTSNLAVVDIDNDNNYEFCFATDKGNIYVYKYHLYNKKFILKKIFKNLWKK